MTEILVPLDGSPQAQRAVPLAVGLARASGSSLRLFESVSLGVAADVPESAPMLEEAAEETLSLAQAEIVARYQIPVETTVQMSFAPDAILATAKAHETRAIVMTTHARTGLVRGVLGSVAEQVLRHATMPVFLLPPPAEVSESGLHHILVPLDGSDASYSVVSEVIDRAHEFHSKVTLLRVYPEPDGPLFADDSRTVVSTVDQITAGVNAAAMVFLQPIQRRLQEAGITCEVLARFGDPAASIVQAAADLGVDAIAMATHGRSGLDRLRHGSVTEAVLRHSPVVVMTFGLEALKALAANVGALADANIARV